MGRSITPRYVVKLVVPGFYLTPSMWRARAQGQVPGDGKPTDENLRRYVEAFEEDCRTGTNKHLGPMNVRQATIQNQITGTTVATYEAPMFQVIS